MAALADMDSACLLILVEESELTGRPISARQVADKFGEKTTEARAKVSLDHLVSIGLAAANFDNWRSSGYQITRLGLVAAERAFEREDNGENTVWKASRAELSDLIPAVSDSVKTSDASIQTEPQVVVNVQNTVDARQAPTNSVPISWAGWAGVVVAVAGILVALWIGGKI